MPRKIVQNHVAAGNDVVGRDKYEINVHKYSPESLLGPIEHLLPKLNQEIQGAPCCETLIDEFAYYYDYKDARPLRTVEQKLAAGGRSDELERALEAKEFFNRKLQKYMFFETAQKLFALILDSIEDAFHSKVRPLIAQQADRSLVDDVISDELIEKIHSQIKGVDILITKKDLRGMIYFLTQKCVFDWD
jgi:hypothetical protein